MKTKSHIPLEIWNQTTDDNGKNASPMDDGCYTPTDGEHRNQ